MLFFANLRNKRDLDGDKYYICGKKVLRFRVQRFLEVFQCTQCLKTQNYIYTMRIFLFLALASLLTFCNREMKNPETRAVMTYQHFCGSCHGAEAESFVQREWKYGNSRLDIIRAIRDGYPSSGTHSYAKVLSEDRILDVASYIVRTMEQQKDKQISSHVITENKFKSEGMSFHLDTIAAGLTSPWGMVFLPGGDLVFTEKTGTIWRINAQHKKTQITGGPKVLDEGQGGLLDVEMHPKFAENHLIYFTYSKPKTTDDGDVVTTAVFRARLEGNELVDGKDIFIAEPYASTHHHFGSRLEFDRAGYLFVTVGERGKQDEFPQFLDKAAGKIHRINDDGSIPTDNPFYNTPNAIKSIWTYGHRNPQGMVLNQVTGELWACEHGPRGGDELNLIQPGKNYGWPIASYGTHYDGRAFTESTTNKEVQSPVLYWVPSIGPCGMTFVTGDRYPAWKGNAMVASLRFKYLNRCEMDGNQVVKQENLLENIGRMRCVAMGPDGYMYVSVEEPGFIFKLIPDLQK